MSAPKFTAAELLAEANHQTDGAWIEGYREHDELAQMLRYAADVIERHEKALAVTNDLSVAWEEFRELLTAYRRECEWTEAVGCFDTSCGQAESGAGWADFCPHCGGKVVTR